LTDLICPSSKKKPPEQGTDTIFYSNGDIYEGSFSLPSGQINDGMRNGYGKYTLKTRERYEGQWKDNKKHGEGSHFYPRGEFYKGGWYGGVEN
jgi:hypothetical protein